MAKKVFYIFLVIVAIIQLFQPDRNHSSENLQSELSNKYKLPDSIENLLSTVCYDCHSNNTDYPFLINIQPIGWYMQSKVNEGKKHLNFSEFGNYSTTEALDKLNEINEVMQKNEMPLHAYRWYNKEANLTDEQRQNITAWTLQLKQNIIQDSLKLTTKDSSIALRNAPSF